MGEHVEIKFYLMSSAHIVGPKNLAHLVGSPGTIVRRIKSKLERKEVQHLLANPESPELAIRGAIAIGRNSSTDYLQPEILIRALPPLDIVANLDKLAGKNQIINAAAALQAVQQSSNKLDPKEQWECIVLLQKSARSWKHFVLDPATASGLISFVKTLTLSLRSIDKPIRNRKPFFEVLTFTLNAATQKPDNSVAALELISHAIDQFGAESEHELDENCQIRDLFMLLLMQFHSLLRDYCLRGDVPAIETSSRWLLRHRFLASFVRPQLEKLWSERIEFSPDVQKFLSSLLGHEFAPDPLGTAATGPQSVGMLQLSSVLLTAWELSRKDPSVQDLLQQLRVTLRDHYSLELFGDVGTKVDFNPRLYESTGEIVHQANPCIARPGVRFESGGATNVLIKALVEWEGQ